MVGYFTRNITRPCCGNIVRVNRCFVFAMTGLYDGKHIPSLPLEGTANTEFCDCDKIERGCWWYLPASLGLIVLAFTVGYLIGAMK